MSNDRRTTTKSLALLLCSVMLAAAGDFQSGAAAVGITPPEGAAMSGYYYNRSAAEGVHDDLYAKALVFAKDGAKAAIVSRGLSGVPRGIVEDTRRLIAEATATPVR